MFFSFLIIHQQRRFSPENKFESIKRCITWHNNFIIDIVLKNQIIFNGRYHLFFVINSKILSSHIYQVSQHMKSTNHHIYYCDQMIKMIVNLGSKRWYKLWQFSKNYWFAELFINDHCWYSWKGCFSNRSKYTYNEIVYIFCKFSLFNIFMFNIWYV